MRNPWGFEYYEGPYCDSCPEWTPEALEQVPNFANDPMDGIFYIPIENFYSFSGFFEFAICYYREGFQISGYEIEDFDMS